jgi:WD40 repeat protein
MMDGNCQAKSYKYKAFITYSHADLSLAAALQSGLHSFAKPWYQLRAVRVFRDQTNLSANPDLWSSIEAAILDSEYLLIMASPEAARSAWVPREIDTFLRSNSLDKVILVLSGGELSWNAARGDFDWSTTTAFPRLERKVFDQLPLYLDLRWARKDEHLSERNPDFRAAVANLSSTLRGIPLDILTGRDVLEHKKTMRLAWSAVSGLSALTLVLGVVSVVAVRARTRAEEQTRIAIEQRNIAVSRQLAEQSRTYLDEQLDLANLLAVEATETRDTVEARGALLDAIQHAPQLITLVRAHAAPVTSVTFSPEGVLASGGRDGDPTIRLWSENALQPLISPIHAEKFRVEHLAFSPDGTTLASAGDGGVVRLWNGMTGESTGQPLILHPPSIENLAFSSKGTLAVSGGWGGLSLWDVTSGKNILPPIQAHPEEWKESGGSSGSNGVRGLAFSPDGGIVATGAQDGIIRLWDSSTLEPILDPIDTHPKSVGIEGVDSLAFSPDGKVLASVSSGALQLWDPSTGQLLTPSVDAGGAKVVIYTLDGLLVSAGTDGYLRVWESSQLKPVGSPIPSHQSYIWSLAVNKKGTIASAGIDGSILLWNLKTTSPIALTMQPHLGRIEGLAYSHEGIVASADSASIKLSTGATGENAGRSLDNVESVSSLAFDSQRILAAGGSKGSIRLWDTGSSSIIATAAKVHTSVTVDGNPMEDSVAAVAFSPDGSTLASAGFIDGSFRLWNGKSLATLTEKAIPAEMGYLDGLAFSPDGGILAMSSENGAIRLWDVRTQRPLTQPIPAHGTGRPLVQFGSDSGTGGKTITIQEGAGPTFVAYSPDGRLASGGFDKQIRIWNGRTGAPIGSPIAFPTPVRSLAFSADGKLLACGGWDGAVRLWDAQSLQFVGSLIGKHTRITHVAFNHDGSSLIASYEDGTVIRWNVGLSVWQAAARTLAHRSLTPAEREKFLNISGQRVAVIPAAKE